MSQSAPPEFDRYAEDYTALHRASIHASGEEPNYFARYKAKYMATRVGAAASGSGLDVLDFGCGVGNSIPFLREAFPRARLYGVDPSGASIRKASDLHADLATFEVGQDDRLPYDDSRFDVIQAACVFHHIRPTERLQWTRELKRVLKPGGCLFVFEHNVLNPLTVRAVHACPFDEDAVLLPRSELLALMRRTGFGRVRARYIVFFPKALAFLRGLEPALGNVPFGAQYVVDALA